MSATLPSPLHRGLTPPRAQRGAAGINQRVADRLLADGRIDGDQHQEVLELAMAQRARVEEAILELDLLGEAELLRYVATHHKTRFVSTEKLSKAAIGARVLDMVSTTTAECHGVFPVLFDDRTGTLSVVTADPDDERALHEVKMAKPAVREIEVLVARPAAVRAAISFHYRGDRAAFRALLPALEAEGRIPNFARDDGRRSSTSIPPASARRNAAPVTPYAPPPSRTSVPPLPRMPPPPALPSSTPGAPASCASSASPHFVETLRALVTFFEQQRGEIGGHAHAVARLVRQTCERMDLGDDHAAALVVAAYVHDLGKGEGLHLTALDVARDDGHRAAAQSSVGQPAQIMKSLDLLPETEAALATMYERWDGGGLPHGHAGKDIPLGGRVLAVADTYVDLTQSLNNRYRRLLRPFEACAVLLKYAGSIFDPGVVDVIRRVIMDTDPRTEMFDDLPEVLKA